MQTKEWELRAEFGMRYARAQDTDIKKLTGAFFARLPMLQMQ